MSDDAIEKNKLNQSIKARFSTLRICKSYQNFEKWKKSMGIPEETKVFICDWNYPDISEAFKRRGWYKNEESESSCFDVKYARKARIPKNLHEWQVLNHFPRNYDLSAKWNLAATIRKNELMTKTSYLTYFPRCFQMEKEGLHEFCNTYKLIYAASMLKKALANPNKSGKNILKANSICRRWVSDLKSKRAKPLESLIYEEDWRELQSLSTQDESLTPSDFEDISSTLNSLKALDPQFDLNGERNIWIIKPGRKSRGRDIKILTDLEEIKSYTLEPNYWVCQKYIENPFLVNSKKFDIRQWVLISNSDPLTIWIYNKCYLRFTALDFSFDDLSNNFMHLTNNSISKKAENFEKADSGFMWHMDQFQAYLYEIYGNDVWPELHKEIKNIVINCILTVGKLGRRNSFELLGLDLMVDTNLKPWLIEINTSPAMDYSTVFHI